MKKILLITAVAIVIISCSKENTKSVSYVATNAISEFQINYLPATGDIITLNVTHESAQDEWKYTFNANQGDVVYLSGFYNDINSALKLMIYIDGKIYKQASNEADTINYLTVSGTIPYE